MDIAVFLDRNSAIPLYYQLEEALKNEIVSGRLGYGGRLPSENEISDALGLSRMTVRTALSRLEQAGYVKKLRGKGSFAVYDAENVGKKRVDVLLDVTYAYFSTNYIKSISEVLSLRDFQFVIHDTRDDPEVIEKTVDSLASSDSSGVIIQPSHKADAPDELLRNGVGKLIRSGIPYVIIDRRPKDVPGEFVVFDDYAGGRLAADYTVGLGHARIAMAACPGFSENAARRDGFSSVLEEKGLPPLLEIDDGDDFENKLCHAVEKSGITAVFAYNDEIALKVIRVLDRAGIRIPDDVSVIGFDDTVFAKAANPPLTSVVHPKELLGRIAAEKLLSMITKNSYEIPEKAFEPVISVRGSCRALEKTES